MPLLIFCYPQFVFATQHESTLLLYSRELGQLITSESERRALNSQRFATSESTKSQSQPEKPDRPTKKTSRQWRIDGISEHFGSDKGVKVSIWLNNTHYTPENLPKGLTLVRDASGDIIGLQAKGHTQGNAQSVTFAKIGEIIRRPLFDETD